VPPSVKIAPHLHRTKSWRCLLSMMSLHWLHWQRLRSFFVIVLDSLVSFYRLSTVMSIFFFSIMNEFAWLFVDPHHQFSLFVYPTNILKFSFDTGKLINCLHFVHFIQRTNVNKPIWINFDFGFCLFHTIVNPILPYCCRLPVC